MKLDQCFRRIKDRDVSCQKLCGDCSVKIDQHPARPLDLTQLKLRAQMWGEVRGNAAVIRVVLGPYELTVFADGGAVVKGTDDLCVACKVYSRCVGLGDSGLCSA
jgi:adenylyltransferase/sulfurtransferase